MSIIATAQKDLEQAINKVSQYESDIKVIETINSQSLQRINSTITDPTYISLVETFNFLPNDVKHKLVTVIDKGDISDFSELLNHVAGLIIAETSEVKQWVDQNRC